MYFKNCRRLGFVFALIVFISESSLSARGMEIVNEDYAEPAANFSESTEVGSDDDVIVSPDADIMIVNYINVGHGDSILIECGGEAVLVDGGESDKGGEGGGLYKAERI